MTSSANITPAMIERVARASFNHWAEHNHIPFKYEDMPEDELEFAHSHARVCIEAFLKEEGA